MGSYNFLPKNIPILVLNQTTKKFGPFLINLPTAPVCSKVILNNVRELCWCCFNDIGEIYTETFRAWAIFADGAAAHWLYVECMETTLKSIDSNLYRPHITPVPPFYIMIVHRNLRYFQVALKSENITMARQVVIYTLPDLCIVNTTSMIEIRTKWWRQLLYPSVTLFIYDWNNGGYWTGTVP
jgi:hypothetical protein